VISRAVVDTGPLVAIVRTREKAERGVGRVQADGPLMRIVSAGCSLTIEGSPCPLPP
jgi:hypothetical protein